MSYMLALLDAVLILDIALAYHPTRNKDGVVRKTARRLLHKQTGLGHTYLAKVIASPHPHQALERLHIALEELVDEQRARST